MGGRSFAHRHPKSGGMYRQPDLGRGFPAGRQSDTGGQPERGGPFPEKSWAQRPPAGAMSKIFFLPTHALELVEAAALKAAMEQDLIESRMPVLALLR